jgi:hypothetical protein
MEENKMAGKGKVTNKMEGKGKKVMVWILGIALAGMIAGFVNLGIEVFYPSPKYEAYCTPEVVEKLPDVYPKQCDVEYQDAINAYNEKVFWVLAPVGFVLVLVGIFYASLLINLIGVFGGSFLVIESILRNLNNKVIAFITLGLIIILIGYFAFKRFKE